VAVGSLSGTVSNAPLWRKPPVTQNENDASVRFIRPPNFARREPAWAAELPAASQAADVGDWTGWKSLPKTQVLSLRLLEGMLNVENG